MYVSQNDRPFELQLFDGRDYVTEATGLRRDLEPLFESMAGKIRRLVLAVKAWPSRPKYRNGHSRALGRAVSDICYDYMRWAKSRGLASVTIYSNAWTLETIAGTFGLSVRKVDPSEFIGPAPSPELERE